MRQARQTFFMLLVGTMTTQLAWADVDLNRDVNCYEHALERSREIFFKVRIDAADIPKLADENATQGVLQGAANLAAAYCSRQPDRLYANGRPMPRPISKIWINITPPDGSQNLVRASFDAASRVWKVEWNNVASEVRAKVQAHERQQAALAEKQNVADVKRQARQPFISQNGIVAFVSTSTLAANPFPYQGKVVGIKTTFGQMVSSTEARFDDLFVSGVSSTQFTQPGQLVVLAVKVSGLKSVKTPVGGELNVPYGSLVGVHICTQSGCSEFFD